jgi:cysteate synthase
MADEVSGRLGFMRDGGAMNPGRRAGMGTAMLHAVAHPTQGTQRTFDHYFQAVGSASGAIAAWEATQLLLADGRFGDTVTQIHMAQNFPFVPIPSAWRAGRRELIPVPEEQAYQQVNAVTAAVLTNRKPPYAVVGGIHDVLSDSGGAAWEVTNERLFHAATMFRSVEGTDISPAASVAVDALKQAVETGRVRPDEHVLLHITGGGREVQYAEGKAFAPSPNITVEPGEIERVIAAIGRPTRISAGKIFHMLRRYGVALPVRRRSSTWNAKPLPLPSPASRSNRAKLSK